MIKKLLKWVFQQELEELKKRTDEEIARLTKKTDKEIKELNTFRNILNAEFNDIKKLIDVSADVHEYSNRSWAVISIPGVKMDYIKFLDMGPMEITEMARFLKQFERANIDASPKFKEFFYSLPK